MIKVGDKRKLLIETGANPEKRYEGECIWIHPEKRFARFEFKMPSGYKIRSCYMLFDGEIVE